MATLLQPRGNDHVGHSSHFPDQAATAGHAQGRAPSSPFLAHVTEPLERPRSVPVAGVMQVTSPSYVQGVSLSGILQMLNLERKTCVLEVMSECKFGTLTLVNGELVDADVDGIEGEQAVYLILAWDRPQTTIMDGVSLFRHTVDLPISKLVLESVRRQDESEHTDRALSGGSNSQPTRAHNARELAGSEMSDRFSEWKWLVETLVISGARRAAVIRTLDEQLLALADEYGGYVQHPSQSEVADLAPIARSARRWTRQLYPAVSEIVVRTAMGQILIAPIDEEQTVFAHAELDLEDSLVLARSAIRSLNR